MKIMTITCEHTRQVRQFEPVRFSITAQIEENEDPILAAKKLQELVLMVTYKDDPKQLKFLVDSLVKVNPPAKENNSNISTPSF